MTDSFTKYSRMQQKYFILDNCVHYATLENHRRKGWNKLCLKVRLWELQSEQILLNATPEATHTFVRILLITQLQMSFTHWSQYRWLIILHTGTGKAISVSKWRHMRGGEVHLCSSSTWALKRREWLESRYDSLNPHPFQEDRASLSTECEAGGTQSRY